MELLRNVSMERADLNGDGFMNRRLKKFAQLSYRKKCMMVEAYTRAFVALIMIRLLPYSFWRRWLGKSVPLRTVPNEIEAPDPTVHQELGDIYWTYEVLARHASYLTCLMLGFSARALMRRRGLPSILVLGVERESAQSNPNLNAHAWVVHQAFDIAGGAQKSGYTAVAAYSSE